MNKDISFYVFNNLRGSQDHVKYEVFRFDSLEKAIDKYNELPIEWTSAIGCSINRTAEIDIVHRIKGLSVFINDYKKLDSFKNREDMNDVISMLKKKLNIFYELISGIHPHVSIIAPMVDNPHLSLFLQNHVLIGRSDHLEDAIDEVYVKDKGWIGKNEFVQLNTNQYLNSYHPIVTQINVKSRNVNNQATEYMDITPQEFILMKAHTLKHLKEKKVSIDEEILNKKKICLKERNEIQKKEDLELE